MAPGGNIFYKRPKKKKQLYRQEVPERRSKIYTNKNFRGIWNFRGISPRLYVWKKHCSLLGERNII